jgi:hypothetical protein
MKPRSYDDLSKQELIEQLKARDRKDATRFGLLAPCSAVLRAILHYQLFRSGDAQFVDELPRFVDGLQSVCAGGGRITRQSAYSKICWRIPVIGQLDLANGCQILFGPLI